MRLKLFDWFSPPVAPVHRPHATRDLRTAEQRRAFDQAVADAQIETAYRLAVQRNIERRRYGR